MCYVDVLCEKEGIVLRIDTNGQLPYEKKGDLSWSK